jgi:hypothetical protein
MSGGRAPHRYPASAFPEIQGIRLSPIGVTGALVNLSATGVLVECTEGVLLGTVLTVNFQGTFSPALVEGRVARCQVSGIAADGSLRFHLGLAFNTRLALAAEAEDYANVPETASSAPPVAAAAGGARVLRNRW